MNKANSVAPEQTLTLAMIVKDAGQFLAPLLASATPWVDAMVIGDTGSSDNTVEIIRSAGATTLEIVWQDDFAAARNLVLDQIPKGWVLCLDADEKLAPGDWRAIRHWISTQQKPSAAQMVTRNYLQGLYSRRGWQAVPNPDPHSLPGPWPPAAGFTPTAKIRLFPSHPHIRFSGVIHETVEAAVATEGWPVVDLDVPVHHFGTLAADPQKAAFYLELARRKTELEPRNAMAWSELTDCAIGCGNLNEALAAIDRALILEPANPDRRLTAGWLLLECGRLNQADAQLAGVAGSGCADDRQLAESCHLRSQIALRQNNHEVAGRLLAVALHLFPNNGHFHNTLGVWHLTAARGDRARVALERACALLPGVTEPWLNLGKMYAAAKQPETAAHNLRNALAIDPQCQAAREALYQLDNDPELAPTGMAG